MKSTCSRLIWYFVLGRRINKRGAANFVKTARSRTSRREGWGVRELSDWGYWEFWLWLHGRLVEVRSSYNHLHKVLGRGWVFLEVFHRWLQNWRMLLLGRKSWNQKMKLCNSCSFWLCWLCQPEAEVVLPLGGLGLARRWLKAQQASVNRRAEFERTSLTQVGCLGIWNSLRAV